MFLCILCFCPSCSRFAGVYAAVRGSPIPRFAGLHARRSREFTPPFAGLPSRGSREFTPPFAALPSRRSRELSPPFAALPSRRSREFMPQFAVQPAHSSQEMTSPSTANPSPPARLWLNARRPASDSSPPDCRWLKLAGLPLTHARWSSLAGKANSLPQFTPPSAAHRPRRSREITPPAMGKPTHRRRLPLFRGESQPAVRGSLGPQPAEAPSSPPAPAVEWSSQPAAAVIVKPAGYGLASRPLPNLTSQPAVAVFDQTVTKVFLTVSECLAPEGSWYPWASPRKFWGGVVGLRPKRLRWGLGPRSRRRSHHGLPSSLLRHGLPSSLLCHGLPSSLLRHGLPSSLLRHGLPSSLLRHGLPSSLLRHGLLSSLLHLDLGLSVPLWRPRPVYVSVSVLWGLQSAHPPSLVVLLRHGTCLPGGGSYVRGVSCVSCVPASCFRIWLVSCNYEFIRSRCV